MPDDLYHRDILAWSTAQAERLRRLAAGERVNDLDWANLIEEIESLGGAGRMLSGPSCGSRCCMR